MQHSLLSGEEVDIYLFTDVNQAEETFSQFNLSRDKFFGICYKDCKLAICLENIVYLYDCKEQVPKSLNRILSSPHIVKAHYGEIEKNNLGIKCLLDVRVLALLQDEKNITFKNLCKKWRMSMPRKEALPYQMCRQAYSCSELVKRLLFCSEIGRSVLEKEKDL